MEKRIAELEAKRTKQENKVIELKSKIEAIQKRNEERKEVEAKKRVEEIAFLKYQEMHLNKYLKQVNNDKWKRDGLKCQIETGGLATGIKPKNWFLTLLGGLRSATHRKTGKSLLHPQIAIRI